MFYKTHLAVVRRPLHYPGSLDGHSVYLDTCDRLSVICIIVDEVQVLPINKERYDLVPGKELYMLKLYAHMLG